MRAFRLVLASVFTLSILSLGLTFAPRAFAEQTALECYPSGQLECDLGVTKQVKVNTGDFVEANSSDQAPQATVGDTLTWQITVTNHSEADYEPYGLVTVHETLPGGVTVTNVDVPEGTTYSNGDWTINLNYVFNEEVQSVTLTITSTATTAGLDDNFVEFTDYNPDNCGDGGPGLCEDPTYSDTNPNNNSQHAFVNVVAKAIPAATTSSIPKAPNTGFGIDQTNPLGVAGIISGGSTMLAGLGYLVRKNALRLPNKG